MRRLVFAMVMVLWTVLAAMPVGHAQAGKPDPSALAGKWQGSVTADAGQMRLLVTLTSKDGKMTGTIENAHGTWTITSVTYADGAWVLPWKTDDGATGVMKGKLTGDEFNGDWDFHPMAVGTFALKRVK